MDWPSNWIQRDFEGLLESASSLGPFSVLLLLGPRQVGKSSLLDRCTPLGTQMVNLDDLDVRT